MIVRLTWSETMIGANLGVMRRISALKLGRKPKYGMDEMNPWTADIIGAHGELAVAKGLKKFWQCTMHTVDQADVAGFEVRTVERCPGDDRRARLMIHPDDDDAARFILVVGAAPVFDLVGWLRGGDGKDEAWWESPRNNGRFAFFVPRDRLRPIEEIEATE